MRTSLSLSVSLHLAVLAIAVLNFSWGGRKDAPPPRPVAIEVLSPSDLSRMKAGNPDKPEAETAPAKSASASEQKAETPPAAPDPKPADKPAEEPARRQAALPPPKPKPARRSTAPIPAVNYTKGENTSASQESPPPETRAKPVIAPLPEKRPAVVRDRAWTAAAESRHLPPRAAGADHDAAREEPERERGHDRIAALLDSSEPETRRRTRFDPNRIAALLNRDPDAVDEARDERPRKPWRRPSSFQEQASSEMPDPREDGRERYGSPSGHDDRMSATEIDAFIAQISRCWTPPVGGLGARDIVVKLHIELREDGRLARPPQVANSGSSPFFTPAADSAVRAVLQCEPYRLPPEKYSYWRDMLLNFDPRQMYGG